MAYTRTLGGFNPKDTGRGPFVPLPVSSLDSRAVEAADLTAGNDASTLFSDGKIANVGSSSRREIVGKVRSISSSTTATTQTPVQNVPQFAMVEFAVPGKVFEFNYNSSEAPAIGDRAQLSSDYSMAGTVMKAAKAALETAFSAESYNYASIISNQVIDIDTVAKTVLVLFLPGGPPVV